MRRLVPLLRWDLIWFSTVAVFIFFALGPDERGHVFAQRGQVESRQQSQQEQVQSRQQSNPTSNCEPEIRTEIVYVDRKVYVDRPHTGEVEKPGIAEGEKPRTTEVDKPRTTELEGLTPQSTTTSQNFRLHQLLLDAQRQTGPDNAAPRYLIWECPGTSRCGGWGSRLKGMAYCFIWALLSRRKFLINVKSPVRLELLLEPANPILNDWRVPGGKIEDLTKNVSKKDIKHYSLLDKTITGLETKHLDEILTHRFVFIQGGASVNLKSLFDSPYHKRDMSDLELTNFDSYPWVTWPHPHLKVIGWALRELFKGSPAVESVVANYASQVEGTLTIASQIRFGRNAGTAFRKIGEPARLTKTEATWFGRCAGNLTQTALKSGKYEKARWFVTSDSSEGVSVMQAARESNTLKDNITVVYMPGSTGHTDLNRPSAAKNIQMAAQWLLFARADLQLLARSSFGETAMAYRGTRGIRSPPDVRSRQTIANNKKNKVMGDFWPMSGDGCTSKYFRF